MRMSITLKELASSGYARAHEENLFDLLSKINKLRDAYGKPLRVTSGYRTLEKHLAIYHAKGIDKVPMKSLHLTGEAVDITPIDGDIADLHKWIKDNVKLMEESGFWFEDFSVTTTWAHCQTRPPKSGKRFFLP